MIIHTVYKPEENFKYIKDWLDHHLAIGIEHFYLYDNRGSVGDHDNEIKDIRYNQYGTLNGSIEQAIEFENTFIKEYPVTKILWQPKNEKGETVYSWANSVLDLSSKIKEGLCAFIDMDEFIIKKEEFFPSAIKQKKFRSRADFDRVTDITETFDINTEKFSRKCILDMSTLPEILYEKNWGFFNMHFMNIDLPYSKNYFNHYNHNEIAHKWLIENYKHFDENWKEVSYENLFYNIDKKDIGLMI